ncbi:MAG: PIN domain-containing protein [Candidatus Bipolaricaulaceae bacterium]
MAKVLVDTSAWIEFYHPQGAAEVKRAVAEALEVHEVSVVAPVIVELLSGTKTKGDYQTLRDDLRALFCLPLGWEEAVAGAELGRKLSRAGWRVPTVDLLIAAAAKCHGHEIWHFGDKHFGAIAEVGGPPQRDLKVTP